MISWRRNLTALWISQFLVLAGFAALIPFIPLVFKNGLHIADQKKLALFISMFSIWGTAGYAVFCPVWGYLSDKIGAKAMLLRGTFVTGFIFPLMAYTSNPWLVIVLRFITSACAGTTSSAQIMIAQTAPLERQGFAQGILNSAYWSGMVFGNVIGGVIIQKFGYQAGFWACGILYFLAGFAVLFTQDAPKVAVETKQEHTTLQEKMHNLLTAFTGNVWALILLFTLAGAIAYYCSPYLAIKIEDLTDTKRAPHWTSIVSAIVCTDSIIAGVTSGYLADRFKAGYLLTLYMLLAAVTLYVEGRANNLIVFTTAQVIMYAAVGGVQPALQKMLAVITPKEKCGTAFGMATTMVSVGSLLSSVVSGIIFAKLSVNWIYYSCAILVLVSWPLYLLFIPYTNTKQE